MLIHDHLSYRFQPLGICQEETVPAYRETQHTYSTKREGSENHHLQKVFELQGDPCHA